MVSSKLLLNGAVKPLQMAIGLWMTGIVEVMDESLPAGSIYKDIYPIYLDQFPGQFGAETLPPGFLHYLTRRFLMQPASTVVECDLTLLGQPPIGLQITDDSAYHGL